MMSAMAAPSAPRARFHFQRTPARDDKDEPIPMTHEDVMEDMEMIFDDFDDARDGNDKLKALQLAEHLVVNPIAPLLLFSD